MTERFELLEKLGKGGMGVVWKARDAETGEIIAIKLLHDVYRDDADYVTRFEREVDIARLIVSPHVVAVKGYGLHEDIPFVAMEYIGGLSLQQKLRADGAMTWDVAKPILEDAAEGLAAAHAAGVIHRDIKPSNILLDGDGPAKIADFGISRALDFTRLTGSATMLGTPAYMSPDGEADERGDLYALGCVLYEILTGTPPFVAESQQQVILKHIREAPDLAKLPDGEARKIAAWLLEKDPAQRPQSANALLAALRETGSGVQSAGAPAPAAGNIYDLGYRGYDGPPGLVEFCAGFGSLVRGRRRPAQQPTSSERRTGLSRKLDRFNNRIRGSALLVPVFVAIWVIVIAVLAVAGSLASLIMQR